ncbi:hypothetical protein M3Y98_00821000 [Aphelenchoides besseyi]|nr:hypothetical protein M3Y98_00821000 [Aphelenchoides besseyi]KAI6212219.1 hypothetical protein M3Y96_00517200 [Aphelenchoides besseyi]
MNGMTVFSSDINKFDWTQLDDVIRSGSVYGPLVRKNVEPLEPIGSVMYSRKVFIGGITTHCTDVELFRVFSPYGKFAITRPNISSGIRSKHYCFLIFDRSDSVATMLRSLIEVDGGYFAEVWCGSRMIKVQVRPFNVFDSKYTTTPHRSVNLRFAVFIGGILRTSRSVELARAFSEFGEVSGVTIDLDPQLLYPRGTARVFFASMDGYAKALRQKTVNVPFEGELKIYEIKPFVLDNPCEECYWRSIATIKAKHFCSYPSCLSYYCDDCWQHVHNRMASNGLRAHHQPFTKGNASPPQSRGYNAHSMVNHVERESAFESFNRSPLKSLLAPFNPQIPPPSSMSLSSQFMQF